jgi:hypothetical protein
VSVLWEQQSVDPDVAISRWNKRTVVSYEGIGKDAVIQPRFCDEKQRVSCMKQTIQMLVTGIKEKDEELKRLHERFF